MIKKILNVVGIKFPEVLLMAPGELVEQSQLSTNLISAQALRQLVADNLVKSDEANIRRIELGESICVAAYAGQQLAGICFYAIGQYPHTGPYTAHIKPGYLCGYGLHIFPEFRGKGVRAALVSCALFWIKANGFQGLFAAIDFENKPSIKSALKLGYKVQGYSYFSRWLPVRKRVSNYYYLTTTAPNLWQRIYNNYRKNGAVNSLIDLAYVLVNKFIELRFLLVYRFAGNKQLDNTLDIRWLSGECLRQLESPELEVQKEWIDAAIEGKQKAAAYFEQGELKSYFWFSDCPVNTSRNYCASVSSDYYYGYKAYTRPDARGRGLFSKLVEFAQSQAVIEGKKGILTHVELNNFSSRKAHINAGGVIVGHHVLLKIFSIKRVFNSTSASQYQSSLIRRN